MPSGHYVVNDTKVSSNRSSWTDGGKKQPVQLTKISRYGAPIAMEEVDGNGKAYYRSSVTRLFSCIYALVLVVLGIVFSTASALTGRERQHYYYLEAFQIYLYFLSLVFMIYVFACLLRGSKNGYSLRYAIRRSRSRSPDRETEEKITDDKESKIRESSPGNDSLSSRLELPEEGTVAHVGEGINFFLRLGAIAFSIGSVTLDGFHIASYFESDFTGTCRSVVFILVYALHLVFTFIQTFFIFKNDKLVINKHKAMVRFGLMHLIATNLCIWVITTVIEAAESFRQQEYHSQYSPSLTPPTPTTATSGKDQQYQRPYLRAYKRGHYDFNFGQGIVTSSTVRSCYEDITLARIASPYLFPCTIQYSIIAAGILFKMYQNVGVKVKQRWPSHMSLTSSQPAGTTSVDCDKANKGLFLGLLIGVVTVIAIATFFVFNSRLTDSDTAIKIFYITEISLLGITLFGVIFGYIRLAQLKFTETRNISLPGFLLIIALFGTYVYDCFVIIAVVFSLKLYGLIGILSLACTCLALVQITIQSAFIFDALRRCSDCEHHITHKPGRAIVTFLLVCNLALSAICIFEVTKTSVVPINRNFYGILAWNIVCHICLPLIIFFRFHSSVCMSDIWYLPYQREKAA